MKFALHPFALIIKELERRWNFQLISKIIVLPAVVAVELVVVVEVEAIVDVIVEDWRTVSNGIPQANFNWSEQSASSQQPESNIFAHFVVEFRGKPE